MKSSREGPWVKVGEVLAAVSVVAALAGCGGQSCTSVGCASQVEVMLPNRFRGRLIDRVEVCAGRRCSTEAVRHTRDSVQEGQVLTSASRVADVRVVVYGANGTRLYATSRQVELQKYEPNGPGCEPVCHSATLRLDATGGLVSSAT